VVGDAVARGSIPSAQCSRNEAHGVGQQPDRAQHVRDDERLEDVELEVARRAPDATATSLPMTWQHTMVRASHWVGFTLPGMMLRPARSPECVSSPRPERGPEAIQRTSLAIFMRAAASVEGAGRLEVRLVGGERLELVGRAGERRPVSAASVSPPVPRNPPAH
jgi:hypothetical protein